MFRQSIILLIIALLFSLKSLSGEPADANPQTSATVVQGTVFDTASAAPLPYVTVQVVGTGKSALVNDEGKYRLLLQPGTYQLKFTHVGYYSKIVDVMVSDSRLTNDVYLRASTIELQGMTVYDKPYDDAQKIILEAIKRKKDILSRIHDYHFDAYAKMVVRDIINKDSSKIFLITETQTTSFWEKPDKYKEVILSRRQSANMNASENLVTVGEVLNFNKNRIEIGRYEIVSPTANDALDNYDYYIKDTLYVDGRRVYRLKIAPKNETSPLFQGLISIADSTFDVVEVDVGVNKAVSIPFISQLRYRQQFLELQNEYWMPIEILLTGKVKISFPGVPPTLTFTQEASLYDYKFETGTPKGTFGEFDLEVKEDADKFDSTKWATRQTIPLTDEELRGYHAIDSVEHQPVPLQKKILNGGAQYLFGTVFGGYDFFRFNRSEGAYVGYAINLDRAIPRTDLWLRTGYAFDARRGEHDYGIRYQLSQGRRLYIGGQYVNRIVRRDGIPGSQYNPTLEAIFGKYDPYDYYLEKGFRGFASTKVVNHLTLDLGLEDFEEHSIGVNTNFSLSRTDRTHRENPPILDGNLRSAQVSLTFDSRKFYRDKGRDRRSYAVQYSTLSLGAEYSSPTFLNSNYDYRKYYVNFYRRQHTFRLGLTSIRLYAGTSDRSLPPQKYFSIPTGSGILADESGFYTLGEIGFVGDRLFSFYIDHNFGQGPLRKCGIPLVNKLPFTLSVHGGSFWSDFRSAHYQNLAYQNLAPRGYHEIGFGLGNLTPFLSVFNFSLYFTWRVSAADANRFDLTLGLWR